MHPLAPFLDRERCAAGVATLAAAAAPKRTSRAVSPGGKRRCCVPSAWAAECARSGVGCSLTPSRSLLLCHRRGCRSRAGGRSQVPDWITHGGLSCNPASFGWRLLRPEGELWCLCVNASEREGENQRGVRQVEPWADWPVRLPSCAIPGPSALWAEVPEGGDSGRNPALASPLARNSSSKERGTGGGRGESRTALLSPAKLEK